MLTTFWRNSLVEGLKIITLNLLSEHNEAMSNDSSRINKE